MARFIRPDTVEWRASMLPTLAISLIVLLLAAINAITGTGRYESVHHLARQVVTRVATSFAPAVEAPETPLDPSMLCLLQLSNYQQGAAEYADLSQMWWHLYAQRHGYQYYRILDTIQPREEDPWGKASFQCYMSWHKLVAVRRMLPHCEIAALLDLDVVMANMSIPLLHALYEFNFTDPAVIAIAADPDAEHNYVESPVDGQKHLFDNTGFVVFRNRPRTYQILSQWLNCSIGGVSGCEEYLAGWPCDQGAWSKYIRPTVRPKDITTLPCTHFNSWPDVTPSNLDGPNCDKRGGLYLQHWWTMHGGAMRRFSDDLDRESINRTQQLGEVSLDKGNLIYINLTDSNSSRDLPPLDARASQFKPQT